MRGEPEREAAGRSRTTGGAALAWATALSLGACAAPEPAAAPPRFAPPRLGVFVEPAPVVETPDDDLAPSLSPGGGRIVYAASTEGNLDVFLRDLGGRRAERLTDSPGDDTDPAFSPDGGRIAWVSQAEDVKGDVWIMDASGAHRRRLTGRESADASPAFSADGRSIYFGALLAGSVLQRIDQIEIESGLRRTVVARGWDPAPSPDGEVLFYAAPGEDGRPRVLALRLRDGRVAPLTEGGYVEGMPRAFRGPAGVSVVFTRFVDDQDGDGVADGDDTPSLWSVPFDPAVFDGAPPAAATPLTSGEGGEVLASVHDGWMVYTAGRSGDVDVLALPTTGAIAAGAAAEAVLQAARAEDDPALRRLALRHVIATAPSLVAPARYELARELAERGRLAEASAELARAAAADPGGSLARVARIEIERLGLLRRLGGRPVAREEADRRDAEARAARAAAIAAEAPGDLAADSRARSLSAEIELALGRRAEAVARLERLARQPGVPPEDAARALDRLAEVYAGLGDEAAVGRVTEELLRRLGGERFYVRRAARRWIDLARASTTTSPLAALEAVSRAHPELPAVAAPAELAMADLQAAAGLRDVAVEGWRRIVTGFPSEREVVSRALAALAADAERRGEPEEALQAYERLLAEHGDERKVRLEARRGVVRIATSKAALEEREGKLEAARESWRRVLAGDPGLVLAHRRYIALSAAVGRLDGILTEYAAQARDRPRSALARYCYGYALTFTRPPRVREAEREVAAALELDPRFAAAHLAMGWLRERREAADPRHGWLERAFESYDTARQLVDRTAEPELWAAITLDRGNLFVADGKDDLAFEEYLARELSGVPHDSPLSELLFRESFARVALRRGAYDVAIDMASMAQRLSRKLAGEPRRGPTAAVLAAAHLLAGNFEDARRWYDEAARLYAARHDGARVVPLLRGRALAEQALGRLEEALATTAEILSLLASGNGPPEPPHGMLVKEIPGDPDDVTRAPWGFAPGQEEELALTLAGRMYRDRGDLSHALDFDARRLALLRGAADDDDFGPRTRGELVRALAESARLEVRAGRPAEAAARLTEALRVERNAPPGPDLATLLESLGWLWAEAPDARTPEAEALALAAAAAAERPDAGLDEGTLRRVARFCALARLGASVTPIHVEPRASVGSLASVLSALDRRAADLELAARDARRSGDPELLASLGRAGSTVPATPELAAGAGDGKGAASAAAVRPPTSGGPAPARSSWRRELDSALAVTGPRRAAAIDRALALYETDPDPTWVPERPLLVELAVERVLATGDVAHAWRLLERERLLSLVPPVSRVRREPLASEWARLRGSRGSASYARDVAAGSELARALEARPATPSEVSAALEGAVLVQAFATSPRTWHWFVLRSDSLSHAVTTPMRDGELPAAVTSLLDAGGPPARLVVDLGELTDLPAWSLTASGVRLGERAEVTEALSATYFVAARGLRNLARGGTLVVGHGLAGADTTVVPADRDPGTTLRSLGSGRRLVELALTGTVQAAPAERPGLAQLVFAAGNGPGARLDLDEVGGSSLASGVALAVHVGPTARAARSVAQAFLLAGVPTVLAGDAPGDAGEVRRDLLGGLAASSAAASFHAVESRPGAALRLFGDFGLDAAGRVDFAVGELMRLAAAARDAYRAAQATPSRGAWLAARDAFEGVLDRADLLREPAASASLAASRDPGRRRLVPSLASVVAVTRSSLASVQVALEDYGQAAALLELVADSYREVGKPRELAQTVLALGSVLSKARRNLDAARAFERCAAVAHDVGEAATEAECLVRRGSEQRTLSDYAGAVRSYQEAIMLDARTGSVAEVQARRYLGFVYESSLADYDRALEQYEAALAIARRKDAREQIPGLLVDSARAHRLRGDFDRALGQVAEAEALLDPSSSQGRAEAAIEAAKVHWYRGNYRRAMERQREGLELARRAGSSFLEIQAQGLAGLVALNQGELARAERAISDALRLAVLTGRKSEQAAQLNNLGIVLREAGRIPEAIDRFRAALAIDEGLGSVEGRGYDLRNLAVALERADRREQALAALDTALSSSRSIGDRYNELQCVLARAEARDAAGSASARADYDLAARLGRERSVPEVEWRALYGLGRLAERAGDAAGARRQYEHALDVAERLGRGPAESFGGRTRDDLYDDAVRLAVSGGDVAGAYALVERARARRVLDLLATRSIDFPSADARALTEAELGTREELLAAARDVDRGVEGASRALAAARAAHELAAAALRRAYPRLYRLFVIDPPPLAALQAVLPRDATVLDFFVGRDALTTLVIRADGARAVRLELPATRLAGEVARLRQGLRAFAPVEDGLAELGSTLLGGLGPEDWATTRTLVLLPWGPLFHVPFAALPVGGDALLARAAIASAPSGALLTDLLSRAPGAAPTSVAALAPADDLPFARLEAAAVAGPLAIVGPDATEERLRSLSVDAVDIAAHAELEPDDALASAVVLARGPGRDGRLELDEIFGLGAAPDLVTLSACDSAAGNVHGDEWLGLGYGFLTAGSRTVVAAQERVSDAAAAVVMKRFYRALGRRSPAEALREAELAARRSFAHPAHWSTFALIGDFR